MNSFHINFGNPSKNQNYKICNFGLVQSYLEYILRGAYVVKTKIIKIIILVKAGKYIVHVNYGSVCSYQNYKICNFGWKDFLVKIFIEQNIYETESKTETETETETEIKISLFQN
jgi:hypothetical protein